MKKFYNLHFYRFGRMLTIVLAIVVLFAVISAPFAHASVAATVVIGAYGVTKVVVSAKVLVGLIVGGFTGFLLEPLLNETDLWYDSDPVVRNWADQYNGKITGGEVVSIPANVQTSIRQKYNVADTVSLSHLYVPYDLTHLENVSAVHIFGQDVAAQLEANNALLQQVNASLNAVRNLLNGALSNIDSHLSSIAINMLALLNKVHEAQLNIWSELGITVSKLEDIRLDFNIKLGTMIDKLEDIRLDINTKLGTLVSKVENIRLNLQIYLEMVANRVTDSSAKLEAKFDVLSGKVDTLIDVLTEPQIEAKPQIEVQAGTQTIVVSDYATLGQAFSAKMGWIPQIFNFLKELFDRIVNPLEPPKIPIHLSDGEGSVDWGFDTYILDMTWYARYKPYVDKILSGILWLVFGWNVYKRIPDILNGVGLSQEPTTNSVHLPSFYNSDQLPTSQKLLGRGRRYD